MPNFLPRLVQCGCRAYRRWYHLTFLCFFFGFGPDTAMAQPQQIRITNPEAGSDTLSNTRGMGASRRWAFKKFQDFSAKNNGRMLVTYLQFNQAVCGMNQHRNVLAVYSKTIPPGTYQVTLQADGKFVSAQTLNIPNHIKIR